MNLWTGLFTGEVPIHEAKEDDEAKSPSQLLSYINGQDQKQEDSFDKETEDLLEFLHKKSTKTEVDPKDQTNTQEEITLDIIDDEPELTSSENQAFVSSNKKLKLIKPYRGEGFIPRNTKG